MNRERNATYLALSAIVFSSCLYGMGNSLFTDPLHRDHSEHSAHYQASATVEIAPQCGFCLEGITPAPVALLSAESLGNAPRDNIPVHQEYCRLIAAIYPNFSPRAPPLIS